MNNTNNASARQSYDIAKNILFNAWIGSFAAANGDDPSLPSPKTVKACWDWVNGRKLSQSEVRLEVELDTNNSIFTFAMTPTQNNTTGVRFNTERRLEQQDSLIASEYGVFVGQASSQTDTTWKLLTYGDRFVLAANDAAAINSTFYSHGSFQMRVNNDVIIPYRGLFNHLYIPQTQQVNALAAGEPIDQIRGAEDGCVTLEPNILLVGSKNYVPQIVLPTALANASANLRAVLIFRGILAQNSTVIN
jgi:hypothetical protein